MLIFENNGEAVLSTAVDASATYLRLTVPSGIASEVYGSDTMLLTITDPGVMGYEVVNALEWGDDGAGNMALKVTRGVEGSQQGWPAGAKISARVTAGMLHRFVQNSGPGLNLTGYGRVALGTEASVAANNGFAALAPSRYITNAWLLGGYPVLQATGLDNNSWMSAVMSVEATGWMPATDLGRAPQWEANHDYRHGDCVAIAARPTTPYVFDILRSEEGVVVNSGPTSPEFRVGMDTGVGVVDDMGMNEAYWRATDPTVGFTKNIRPDNVMLYLTEVGFLCDKFTAGAVPSVEVYASGASEFLIASGALDQINGANQIHRFTTVGNKGVRGLRFKRTVAGAGEFRGRFYFKGMFVETQGG